MTSRAIIIIVLIAFTNLLLGGCTKIVKRQFDETGNNPKRNISSVVTKQGEEVKFDDRGGTMDNERKAVTDKIDHGLPVSIALAEVELLKFKKTAVLKSALVTTAVVGVVAMFGYLIYVGEGFGGGSTNAW